MSFLRFIAIGIIFATVAWAQGQHSTTQTSPYENELIQLTGEVVDSSGAVVSHAVITVRSSATGKSYSTTTDFSGRFSLSVPRGEYVIEVNVSGFATTRLHVQLTPAQSAPVHVVVGRAREMAPPPPPPTSPPPPAPVPRQRYADISLTWNAWAEEPSSRINFTPLPAVQKNAQYTIVIDLAALSYGTKAGVFVTAASKDAKDWLLSSTLNDVELRLIAIPDEKYFDPLADRDRFRTLVVNLEQLRRALKQGVEIPEDPFLALKANPNSEFSFGRDAIKVRTRSVEGPSSIAFALWTSSGTPIDEFSMPVCVAHDEETRERLCDQQPAQRPLAGIDSVRAATQLKSGGRPDGSLHFIQLDPDTMVGLFRNNTAKKEKYVSWYLDDTPGGLLNNLQSILKNFDENQDEASLAATGTGLYNLLFPSSRAADARTKFEKFAQRATSGTRAGLPPSIFVRLIADRSTPPFLLPLGLMTYPRGDKQEFLGFHFRILTPLQVQDYAPRTSCLANWVVLAPTDQGAPEELKTAVQRFSDWYADWKNNPRFSSLPDIASLRGWLAQPTEDATPTALFVLAHHDSGSLYITPSPRFGAMEIRREFTTPALAVINACGDAAPGASQVVQRLNRNGVSAVIGTALKVEPYLAGDFFATLGKVIEENQQKTGYPIGLAFFEAVQRLSKMQSSDPDNRQKRTYGAKALAYEFLGNGSLLVCSPRVEPAPSP